jgi:hypothetical protein
MPNFGNIFQNSLFHHIKALFLENFPPKFGFLSIELKFANPDHELQHDANCGTLGIMKKFFMRECVADVYLGCFTSD